MKKCLNIKMFECLNARMISIVLLSLLSVTASATQYSKLKMVRALKEAGRWGDFKSFVSQAGLMDEWQSCAYISDDYPDFSLVTNRLVAAGFATAAEVESLLAAAVDNAADALISQVYSRDMATSSGRMRWHGKAAQVTTDTNTLEKVTIYEDGYRHVEKFTPPRLPTMEEQLAAAERAKRREKAAARRKAARIAELTTNLAFHVEKAMASRHWPEDLARLYLQHELNTLIGTNTVTIVTGPAQ